MLSRWIPSQSAQRPVRISSWYLGHKVSGTFWVYPAVTSISCRALILAPHPLSPAMPQPRDPGLTLILLNLLSLSYSHPSGQTLTCLAPGWNTDGQQLSWLQPMELASPLGLPQPLQWAIRHFTFVPLPVALIPCVGLTTSTLSSGDQEHQICATWSTSSTPASPFYLLPHWSTQLPSANP